MPHPNPAVQDAMAKAMALFKEHPDRVFTVQEIRRYLKDDSKNLNDALVNLARMKKHPVMRVGYGKYVLITTSSAVKKTVRNRQKPFSRKPHVASPSLSDPWFKVKFVPSALTAFVPLKDGEKIVVTEDDRYFILTELSTP